LPFFEISIYPGVFNFDRVIHLPGTRLIRVCLVVCGRYGGDVDRGTIQLNSMDEDITEHIQQDNEIFTTLSKLLFPFLMVSPCMITLPQK